MDDFITRGDQEPPSSFSRSHLKDLNDELLGLILNSGELGVEDVLRASRVCSRWHRLAREDALWQRLCEQHFASKQETTAAAPGATQSLAASSSDKVSKQAGAGLGTAAAGASAAPTATCAGEPAANSTWHARFKHRCAQASRGMQLPHKVRPADGNRCLPGAVDDDPAGRDEFCPCVDLPYSPGIRHAHMHSEGLSVHAAVACGLAASVGGWRRRKKRASSAASRA